MRVDVSNEREAILGLGDIERADHGRKRIARRGAPWVRQDAFETERDEPIRVTVAHLGARRFERRANLVPER